MLALADASKGDPVVGGLLFFGLIIVGLAWYGWDRGRAPNISCRCRGGRVQSSLRSDAWGPHKACEGRGHRRRIL